MLQNSLIIVDLKSLSAISAIGYITLLARIDATVLLCSKQLNYTMQIDTMYVFF